MVKIGKSNYYEDAESDSWMNIFWAESSQFKKMFAKLDVSSVVELACGHGRHVQQYINDSSSITFVDINEENIAFCKNRFKEDTRFHYLVTSGNNFSGIKAASQTAVFSYDVMVHFEMLAVSDYLSETFRILCPGGKALFHHSNYTGNPDNSYKDSPGWRNFMSADIFRYLAKRCGFTVLAQHVIDWSVPRLDCLTLLEKNA